MRKPPAGSALPADVTRSARSWLRVTVIGNRRGPDDEEVFSVAGDGGVLRAEFGVAQPNDGPLQRHQEDAFDIRREVGERVFRSGRFDPCLVPLPAGASRFRYFAFFALFSSHGAASSKSA